MKSTTVSSNEKRITRASAKPLQDNIANPAPSNDQQNTTHCFQKPSSALPVREAPTRKRRTKKTSFPFLSLPPEIRVKIYHLVLTYDHILVRRAKSRRAASLLLVNRFISSEAFSIFYDSNVFQVRINGLRSHTEAAFSTVRYMRQCCLHLEVTLRAREKQVRLLLHKFLEAIWSGSMECLLIDIWLPTDLHYGTTYLEEFTWLGGIHLVQVVVNKIKSEEEPFRDRWCQRVERSMMMSRLEHNDWSLYLEDEYVVEPRLGIDLVGEELVNAKRRGGWVLKENGLYVLFGMLSCTP